MPICQKAPSRLFLKMASNGRIVGSPHTSESSIAEDIIDDCEDDDNECSVAEYKLVRVRNAVVKRSTTLKWK